jgi:hypothetical protein
LHALKSSAFGGALFRQLCPAHAQKKIASAVAAVLLLIALFTGWYAIAANYDYGALAGTYVLNRNAES